MDGAAPPLSSHMQRCVAVSSRNEGPEGSYRQGCAELLLEVPISERLYGCLRRLEQKGVSLSMPAIPIIATL